MGVCRQLANLSDFVSRPAPVYPLSEHEKEILQLFYSAQSSGHGWIHTEAQWLWQVLCASQAGDLPEDWVYGRDHSDEDEAEDQVHQFGGAAPTGAS